MPKRLKAKPSETTITSKRYTGSLLAYLNMFWDGRKVIPPTRKGNLD